MRLTYKQEQGLKIALERFAAGEKYTVISGFAGTGKSTLVKFIIAALCNCGIHEEDVCFCAFTGKACNVLQKKGNENVLTLHKLLYEHIPKREGGFFRKKKEALEYRVIVVDECSMMPKDLMEDLHRHQNVYIIYLGDPFQLPPIDKNADNHLLDKPHVFLDEIMRQAQESEIIRLTMDIRAGKIPQYCDGNEVKVVQELYTGMMTWADQMICGTNATRVAINNQMRQLLGRGDMPEDGDKLICLRNYWDIFSEDGSPLVNGTIGFLGESYDSFFRVPQWAGDEGEVLMTCGNFVSDGAEIYKGLEMDKKLILTGNKSLSWKTSWKLSKSKKQTFPDPLEFTYGYAITCHKSQGSEWDKVLVIEEKFPYATIEHARWLYTACTRSVSKLVLVR